ncbi:hypothetical protein PENSPDRAFT_728753 [Peniophora sp. CONT]|nr:hypothetical protein PENSPDRAFT_728753 [Peniophora sp. CONT]
MRLVYKVMCGVRGYKMRRRAVRACTGACAPEHGVCARAVAKGVQAIGAAAKIQGRKLTSGVRGRERQLRQRPSRPARDSWLFNGLLFSRDVDTAKPNFITIFKTCSKGKSWTTAHLTHTRLKERSAEETVELYNARLSEDIGYLQQALLRATALYNADAYLLSLPDELIAEIFLYLRDAVPQIQAKADDLASSSPWFKAVMICRRLRRVILESAALHTQISTSTHSCENITRDFALSKALPISLEAHYPSKRYRLYKQLQLHGHRICFLSLILGPSCSQAVSYWIYHMPALAALELHSIFSNAPDDDEVAVSRVPNARIPAGISSLILDGVRIRLAGYHIFNNLRFLSLINVHLNTHRGDELSSIFARAVRMEELTIKYSRVNVDQPEFVHPDMHSSLRRIVYYAARDYHFDIISSLSSLCSVRVKLVCTAPPGEAVYFEDCKSVLYEWLVDDNSGSFKLAPETVSLRISSNTIALDAQLDFWRRSADAVAGHDPDFKFHAYMDEDTTIKDILHGPDYSSVRHFTLDIDLDAYPLFFIFWSLEQMEERPMPHLQSLTVRLSCSDEDNGSWRLANCAEELHLWLRWRRERGEALGTLIVSRRVLDMLNEISHRKRTWYTPDQRGLETKVAVKVGPHWVTLVSFVDVVERGSES